MSALTSYQPLQYISQTHPRVSKGTISVSLISENFALR